MTAGKWNKLIALQKVKDTLAEQICDDANVISEVESVAQVDALVSVVFVV